MFAAEGASLADAVLAALPAWSVRVVTALGGPADRAEVAGREAAAAIGPALRALLTRDVDDQRANPLAIADATMPKLRILKLPEFLGIATALALVALAIHVWLPV